jgi:molybdate transport system regulatory protein
LKTSARNQWKGRVQRIELGAVTAEVLVVLESGAEIIAAVTLEAMKRLALVYGSEVLVMVKASMVMLALDLDAYAFSARNKLRGHVSRICTGPVTSEIQIDLEMGGQVIVAITSESRTTLGLSEGLPACALFKSSAVILAVPTDAI